MVIPAEIYLCSDKALLWRNYDHGKDGGMYIFLGCIANVNIENY